MDGFWVILILVFLFFGIRAWSWKLHNDEYYRNYKGEFTLRKLKLFMDNPNYMCISNTHIFINFDNKDLEQLNILKPGSVDTVHIFITTHSAINASLKMFIEKYKNLVIDGKKYNVRIILHLPVAVKEFVPLVKKFLGPEEGYKLLVERKGPKFSLDTYPDSFHSIYTWLEIIYGENSLKLDITRSINSNWIGSYGKGGYPTIIKFPEYPYNIIDKENDPGIFESAQMRLDPDMFRDKIIKAFKEKTPEGILKSFKNDDEIWEYIMQQGQWKIQDARMQAGLIRMEHADVPPMKGISALEVSGEPIDKTLGKFADGMVVAVVGHGGASGIKKLQELINQGKIAMIDEMPILPEIKPPEPVQFPDLDFGTPRNRAERRLAKKRGGK
jgi:hypothetical protein